MFNSQDKLIMQFLSVFVFFSGQANFIYADAELSKQCVILLGRVVKNENRRALSTMSKEQREFMVGFSSLLENPAQLLKQQNLPITKKTMSMAVLAIHQNAINRAKNLLNQQAINFEIIEEPSTTPYGELKVPVIVIKQEGSHPLNELARNAHELLDGLSLRFSAAQLLSGEAAYNSDHIYYLPLERIADPNIGHIDLHELTHALIATRFVRSPIATHAHRERGEGGYDNDFGYDELATYVFQARVISIALRRATDTKSKERLIADLRNCLYQIQQMNLTAAKNITNFQHAEVKSFRQLKNLNGVKTPAFTVKVNINDAIVEVPMWSPDLAQRLGAPLEGKRPKMLEELDRYAELKPLAFTEAVKVLEKLKTGITDYRQITNQLSNFTSKGDLSSTDIQQLQDILRNATRALSPLFESTDSKP